MRLCIIALIIVSAVLGQDLPAGRIIDDVKCNADATQSYALYLPSHYKPDKKWNLVLAFDPRGRGRVPVERYQAAAEKFGYIVAGSNNSRNGLVAPEVEAAQAMEHDVEARFSIDPKRIYLAGQSGGARLILDLAVTAKDKFAGVIPSSAGFPPEMGVELDLPFVVFGTAGTEDFNYLELTRLERTVATPHRVRIFSGEHTWLPSELAVEALEWMEVQAMKSGTRPRDEAMIDRLFTARKAEAETALSVGKAEAYYATFAVATEFEGLRDVKAWDTKLETMSNDPEVVDAVRKLVMADLAENQMEVQTRNLTDQLDNPAQRAESFDKLRTMLTRLGREAHGLDDTPGRQRARRLLHDAISYNGPRKDDEYRKLLDQVKP